MKRIAAGIFCSFLFMFFPPRQASAATLFDEQFSSDVFTSGSWDRTDSSVYVDSNNGWLHISHDGASDDSATKTLDLPLPIVVEARARLVSGGNNYVIPGFEFYCGPNPSDRIYATATRGPSTGDRGWTFGFFPSGFENAGLSKLPSGENIWVTIRIDITSSGGNLYAKFDSDSSFVFVNHQNWSTSDRLTKLRIFQEWDAVCDIDYLIIRTESLDPVLWPTSVGGNNHWYEAVLTGAITWPQAKTAAEAQGGHLVTIASANENAFIYSLVSGKPDFMSSGYGPWLGGYQPDGSPEPDGGWRWVTDEPWNYTNWASGEPNNAGDEKYLHLRPEGYWNDANQPSPLPAGFIMEWDTAVPPNISSQPTSQAVPAGSSATFSVSANGAGTLYYQWYFNGVAITGKTDNTLSLSFVTAASSGSYSVRVQNMAGSTFSQVASLAILADGANGNTPAQTTAPLFPSKPSGVNNLVFVTHGWQSKELNPNCPPLQPWMVEMTNDIVQQLVTSGQSSKWQVGAYYWLSNAWTLLPDTALNNAKNIGTQLGEQLAAQGYQRVHLIAHSAGAALIQAIADQLKSAPNPPIIQTTFLDPYVGFDSQGVSWYGKNADWSDQYFTPFDLTSLDLLDIRSTGIQLPNAYAVDVSWLDVLTTVNFESLAIPISSHGWPCDFYNETVSGTVSSCAANYGFPRSLEGGGWNSRSGYPIGNTPVSVPCGQSSLSQNLFPIGLGLPLSISLSPVALSDFGSSLAGDAGFVLNSVWSALPLVKSGGVQPMDNPSSTNTPAWLAVGVTVTNAVNFVQFDAAFTDTNSAQGLLTVYWNTNQIGMVDERVAETNVQTYRFTLPGSVSSGIYTLSFRLDSFDNSSSTAVTNVATGFVGVTQPMTLDISLTNGSTSLQLTGATNFTYLLQTSTNLVDWAPTALLLNTNGTVQFTDSAATNSARFYRAVMP